MTSNNPTYYDVSILVEELQALFQTPETALATATKKNHHIKKFPSRNLPIWREKERENKKPISSPFFSFPRRENEKNNNYLKK